MREVAVALEALAAGDPGPALELPRYGDPTAERLATAARAAAAAAQAAAQAPAPEVPLEELVAAATRHEVVLREHASAIDELSTTMEELKGASDGIAGSADHVATVAARSLEEARLGEGSARALVDGLERIHVNATAVHDAISGLVQRIEGVVALVEEIDDVADRADLLALNAALEASRAGEAGAGFAIVATEMRRLAEKVMGSTRGIQTLISETRDATRAALAASEKNRDVAIDSEELGMAATASLDQLVTGVQETATAAAVIRQATDQQRTATTEAVRAMGELRDAAVKLRELAEDFTLRVHATAQPLRD